MWWVVGFVALGLASIGLLLALTIRLWRQVRAFGRAVAASSSRIADATAELERVAGDGVRR